MANQNLVEQINSALAQGRSKEDIYKDLLTRGAAVEAIGEAFAEYNAPQEKAKEKEDLQKKTIHIVLTGGALLIGAGIFSLVASNWEAMGSFAKIILIISCMLISYLAGWHFKENKGYKRTGEALYFLGSIIYGSGIFLIGQIFHARGNWPDGLIMWMIGATAMAFATGSHSLFALAIVVGMVAVVGQPIFILETFADTFMFTSVFLLIFATVLAFACGWWVRRKLILEEAEGGA